LFDAASAETAILKHNGEPPAMRAIIHGAETDFKPVIIRDKGHQFRNLVANADGLGYSPLSLSPSR